MPDLNVRFSNCFDFINETRQYLEANPTDWRNIYTMEDLIRAECDLCEMEMDALYDAEEYDNVLNRNAFRTAKKAQRRKQNKKNKSRDRIHGRRHSGVHGGVDFRYVDCNPYITKDSYYDAMHKDNGKRHNTSKRKSIMSAKEKDYSLAFTGFGELLEDINYLEDRIHIYEEDIKDLEYEKAFGYLTERGEEFLEDYKKELEELKEYKKYKEVLLRTATH